jgi:mutator protein MutT
MKVHRYVGIILVNPRKEVLLQLRDENVTLYPNHWTLPGGKVEEGETPEQAICREVEEELGVNLKDYTLFRKEVLEETSDKIIERYIFWGNISMRLEDLKIGEGIDLRYFASKEISLLKIGFDLKPIIEDFMQRLTTKPHSD